MSEERARRAAETIWRAWRQGSRLASLPEEARPQTLDEGYAAQRLLAGLTGSVSYGWKIAATSSEGQRHIGVDGPLAGRLFPAFRFADGAAVPASRLGMRCAEAEFAFRMARPLPPRDKPYTEGEVMDAVAALHLAIEIPDSRFADFAAAGGAQLAADDACAGYFVLGAEAGTWGGRDLAGVRVDAELNGRPAAQGSGANVLGDPRRALLWMANHLARHEGGLKAGEVVTTGTAIKPVTIAPGDAVLVRFDGLGQISVRFTA